MGIPRLSKAEIQADLDSSLQRLGVECIDLYWLHRDSSGYPVEEILQSLEGFRKEGKIKHALDFRIGRNYGRRKHVSLRSASALRVSWQVRTCGA